MARGQDLRLPAALQSRRPAFGRSAPANIEPHPGGEVWGVLYRLTRHQVVQLDATEGTRYRHVRIRGEDKDGRPLEAVTYLAKGKAKDGKSVAALSTLLRDGARAHDLPEHWIRYLESLKHAE